MWRRGELSHFSLKVCGIKGKTGPGRQKAELLRVRVQTGNFEFDLKGKGKEKEIYFEFYCVMYCVPLRIGKPAETSDKISIKLM